MTVALAIEVGSLGLPVGLAVHHELSRDSRAFVFSSLGTSHRRHVSELDDDNFHALIMAPMERAVSTGGVRMNLLTLVGDADAFVGWSATLGDALVFVYVKKDFRRRGFGRALLPDGLRRVVMQTPAGVHLQRARYGRPLKNAPMMLVAL